jgi:hypothetical protein
MTSLQKVEAQLVGNPGKRYCADCLSMTLAIKPRQQVQQKTAQLAKDPRFRRDRGFCDGHRSDDKFVIGLR